MQEHWDSNVFCFGGGQICGGFPPLLRFGAERPDLPLFLLHPRTAIFKAHLLSPQKIGQLWTLKSYKVLNPLYHCYTLTDRKKEKGKKKETVHSSFLSFCMFEDPT